MLDTLKQAPAMGIGTSTAKGESISHDQARMPAVPHRDWSTSAASLSVLGIGCARAGSMRNQTPVSEIGNMLAMAFDHGVNVVDTANIYGQGDSERIIARAVKGRRDQAFIVTKIGYSYGNGSALFRLAKPFLRQAVRHSKSFSARLGQARDAVINQNFSPEQLARDLDGSLGRLDLDTVDGLLLHDPSTAVLKDEAVVEFLNTAKRQGKVRHFGASVGTLEEAVSALAMPGAELLQVDVPTAQQLSVHPASGLIREKGIALFVREVLRPKGAERLTPPVNIERALTKAMIVSNVTTAIVGISSRAHLQQAIDAVS